MAVYILKSIKVHPPMIKIKQIISEHKLIIYSCSNAWWEPWM